VIARGELRLSCAASEAELEDVFRLRYRAYRSVDAVEDEPTGRFADPFDGQANRVVVCVHHQERLVGALRVMWTDTTSGLGVPEAVGCPTVFEELSAGSRVVVGNRLVVDPATVDRQRTIVETLLRGYMVVAEGKADVAMAAVRRRHAGFYRRILGLKMHPTSFRYPGLLVNMHLAACRYREEIDRVYARTPHLRPSAEDRLALLGALTLGSAS
jgi:hypothetical protein